MGSLYPDASHGVPEELTKVQKEPTGQAPEQAPEKGQLLSFHCYLSLVHWKVGFVIVGSNVDDSCLCEIFCCFWFMQRFVCMQDDSA